MDSKNAIRMKVHFIFVKGELVQSIIIEIIKQVLEEKNRVRAE